MLGVSAMMGASGDAATAAAATAAAADAAQPETLESGAASGPADAGEGGAGEVGVAAQTSAAGLSEEDNKLRMEEVDRSSGGNRWPRQETLALLKIRSDMGAAFRDSSLKGPLWEEVSRKLAELGYHRSAKKCKEKFENVLKYHKRTKEGRAMKPDSKTYRFFDQLEALENQPPPPPLLPPPRPPPQAMPVAMAIPANNPPIASQTTVPSTENPITTVATGLSPINPLPQPQPAPAATAMAPNPISFSAIPASHGPTMAVNFGSISTSSSSSTSSDEEPERRRKRKRKWESFFQRLMNEVISKQEEMQKNFLETLERRERDRMAREEAWRVQEMARMNREHDLLVQERSMAAAKDAAVIAFLQKVSDQQTPNVAQLQAQMQAPPPPQPPPPPAVVQPQQQPQPPPPPPLQPQPQGRIQSTESFGNPRSESFSSSRWPKVEVQALIKIRTSLDNKYQENGPKGPLWEEISASMAKLGYNRSAKRCKEKWENINKYFKKVKPLSHPGIRCRCLAAYGDAVSAVKWASRLGREHHDDLAQFMLGMGYANEALHLPGISKRLEFDLAMKSNDLKRALQCLLTMSNSRDIGQDTVGLNLTDILSLTDRKENIVDAVQGVVKFAKEFLDLIDAADATAQGDIAREALKRLAAAGSVKGALRGHELRGLALRLANHGELTRLSNLVNNLISVGSGREAAFAAAVLGDNTLMEKAWQDTGMLAEAVLHAHAHGRPSLRTLVQAWNKVLQKEKEGTPSKTTDAAAAFLASLEDPKLTSLADAAKKPPIEILPPGMTSLYGPIPGQKKPGPLSQGSQQQPGKPMLLEAPPAATPVSAPQPAESGVPPPSDSSAPPPSEPTPPPPLPSESSAPPPAESSASPPSDSNPSAPSDSATPASLEPNAPPLAPSESNAPPPSEPSARTPDNQTPPSSADDNLLLIPTESVVAAASASSQAMTEPPHPVTNVQGMDFFL